MFFIPVDRLSAAGIFLFVYFVLDRAADVIYTIK